jgi:hypothetical protein
MKKNTLLLNLTAFVAASLPVSAEWSVISTFDDESALSIVEDIPNTENSNARSEIVDGMLGLYPGDLFDATSNLFALVDLGVDLKAASISASGPVTFYFEMYHPTVTVDDGNGGTTTRQAIADIAFGLSNEDSDTVETVRYDSFNVMHRINSGNINWEPRSTSYVPQGILTADTKHSVWVVVDYNLNYCQMYVQGGTYTSQTPLDAGEGNGNFWFFRADPAATSTVDKFLFALSRGLVGNEKGKDSFFFDNFVVDTAGENLTMPDVGGSTKGPGYFGNFDVVMAGGEPWVDTGDWLGWVSVGSYPFVYILNLESFGYVSDPSVTGDKDAGGFWMYSFKN